MHTRAARLTLLTLLLVSAMGAGLVVWSVEQRLRLLSASERNAEEQLHRIAELGTALGSAQLAYSASPQTDDGWFGHISRLVESIEVEATQLGTESTAEGVSRALRGFQDSANVIIQATARARDNLAAGNDLMAADLVLLETRQNVDAMASSLRQLQTARTTVFNADRAALEQRSWTVISSVGAFWVLGLVVLAWPLAARPAQAVSQPASGMLMLGDFSASAPGSAPEVQVPDLSAAAEVCAAISRMTTAEQVPALLSRTAAILDASGIILWMGTGHELVATASHGYEPGLISRISPIPLTTQNPTTAAWHAGEIRTVPSGTDTIGAIVAPMWGPAGCAGVLAAEVRHGRESDPFARAVITMISAQFSTTLTPWPSAHDETLRKSAELEAHADLPLKMAGA